MKTQTVYLEVLCSERFPKKGEQVVAIFENSDIQDGYFTDFRMGDEYICKDEITFFSKESGEHKYSPTQPEPIMWLEKLEDKVVMSEKELYDEMLYFALWCDLHYSLYDNSENMNRDIIDEYKKCKGLNPQS